MSAAINPQPLAPLGCPVHHIDAARCGIHRESADQIHSIMPHRSQNIEYRRSLQHRAFEAGILLKGIDGLLEVIGGALVWFVTPALLVSVFRTLYGHEIFRVAGEQVGFHLRAASEKFANGGKIFPSLFLVSHGITKILLVIAIWRNKLWAYPLMIFVFGAFAIYQVYRLVHTQSVILAFLTVVDVAIIYLTWREYQEQRAIRDRQLSLEL
jgi:uncharacterized membrane protein